MSEPRWAPEPTNAVGVEAMIMRHTESGETFIVRAARNHLPPPDAALYWWGVLVDTLIMSMKDDPPRVGDKLSVHYIDADGRPI